MRVRLPALLCGSALLALTANAGRARAQAADTVAVASAMADSTTGAADVAPERLRGFLARKAVRRDAYFFVQEQVQAGNAQRLSEVVRNVPGLRLVGSTSAGSEVRLRGCRPLVWLDGVRSLGAELDDTASVNDVAAIEVYVSPASVPAEYRDNRVSCGAILLWSRS